MALFTVGKRLINNVSVVSNAVIHKCYNRISCDGLYFKYVTGEECCLHSEDGLSYHTANECNDCTGI